MTLARQNTKMFGINGLLEYSLRRIYFCLKLASFSMTLTYTYMIVNLLRWKSYRFNYLQVHPRLRQRQKLFRGLAPTLKLAGFAVVLHANNCVTIIQLPNVK